MVVPWMDGIPNKISCNLLKCQERTKPFDSKKWIFFVMEAVAYDYQAVAGVTGSPDNSSSGVELVGMVARARFGSKHFGIHFNTFCHTAHGQFCIIQVSGNKFGA